MFKNLFSLRFKSLYLKIKFFGTKFDLSFYDIASFVKSLFKIYNYRAIVMLLKCNDQDVVIIEPNGFHGEILPAWSFYIKKNGLNPLFVVHPKIYNENPFYNDNSARFLRMDLDFILILINLGALSKCKKVFFNSDFAYQRPYGGKRFLYNDIGYKYSANIRFLSHRINDSMQNKGHVDIKNIITLSRYISNHTGCDHFFPRINNIRPSYKALKRIVIVGDLKHSSKDYNGFLSAIEKLPKVNPVFSIDVIGKMPKDFPRSDSVTYHNRLNFKDLHELLTQCNFILFLLKSAEGYEYKTLGITGSFVLALNYGIVPILEESFQEFYELNKNNSIIYKKEQGVSHALSQISQMPKERYDQLQKNLIKLSNDLERDTFRNLDFNQ